MYLTGSICQTIQQRPKMVAWMQAGDRPCRGLMSWDWCSYIYSHFHKKGTVAYITRKIALIYSFINLFIGSQNQRFRLKRGCFFRPKSAKRGCFSNLVTSVVDALLWSGVGVGEGLMIVCTAAYRSGHEYATVLLPGFAISWQQNQVTRQPQFRGLTHMYIEPCARFVSLIPSRPSDT